MKNICIKIIFFSLFFCTSNFLSTAGLHIENRSTQEITYTVYLSDKKKTIEEGLLAPGEKRDIDAFFEGFDSMIIKRGQATYQLKLNIPWISGWSTFKINDAGIEADRVVTYIK